MKKKLGILLLAASMLTFATACGDKDEDKTTTIEATTEATTEVEAQATGDRVELDKFHGIFTVTYDSSLYKEPEPSDLADLVSLDPTKNTNLFISTLDGLDFVEEKMDYLKKYDADPEEIKNGDYTGYLFEYDDDFMGHTLEYIISLEDEVKSSDNYYNNVAGIYIHGSDTNKDAIANDEFRAIIESVKIGDFTSAGDDDSSATDAADDTSEFFAMISSLTRFISTSSFSISTLTVLFTTGLLAPFLAGALPPCAAGAAAGAAAAAGAGEAGAAVSSFAGWAVSAAPDSSLASTAFSLASPLAMASAALTFSPITFSISDTLMMAASTLS